MKTKKIKTKNVKQELMDWLKQHSNKQVNITTPKLDINNVEINSIELIDTDDILVINNQIEIDIEGADELEYYAKDSIVINWIDTYDLSEIDTYINIQIKK